MFGRTGAQHRIGNRDGIEKAGTDRRHVERDAVWRAEQRLDLGGGGREGVVGRRGRDDDQADVRRRQTRRLQRLARRIGAQRRGRFIGFGDMAKADAGAFDDPFVAGIDAFGEFGVGNAGARERRAGAGEDSAPGHAAASLRKLARSSVTWRVMSFSTSSAHRCTAFATPFASALPWLLSTTPLRPRNTAPL